jgi:hypothetical protein
VKIKVERSGGFGGISSINEINADELPPSLAETVRSLVDSGRSVIMKGTKPKGAADYLNYKITIQNGKKSQVIECSEFGIDENVKSLVSYVEKKSNK